MFKPTGVMLFPHTQVFYMSHHSTLKQVSQQLLGLINPLCRLVEIRWLACHILGLNAEGGLKNADPILLNSGEHLVGIVL